MDLLFGLDSGGTKTLAAIADGSGAVLRVAAAGSLDPLAVPDWRGRLDRLVEELTEGLKMPIGAAVLGLPFHGEIAEVSQAQDEAAKGLFDCPSIVENDVRIAFDGAFAGGGGVLVLSGTGSMAWASQGGPDAVHVRTGGWGDLIGDEGSAYWIGRKALAHVSHSIDGRAPWDELSSGLLNRIGTRAEDLMGWLYRQENPRRAIAGLALHVAALAEARVPVAVSLMQEAADCLAIAAQAAWRQLATDAPPRWSFAGGVMHSTVLRTHLAERLGTTPADACLPPVGGALLRAAQVCGVSADSAWVTRLSKQLDAKMRQ